MNWWRRFRVWRRTRAITRETEQAIAEVQGKWMYFINNVHFRDEVPLSVRIDLFSRPVHEYMVSQHPRVMQHPSMFWLVVSAAIVRTRTHTQGDIECALRTLAHGIPQAAD